MPEGNQAYRNPPDRAVNRLLEPNCVPLFVFCG